jgi:hypothetical protein
MFLTVGRSCFIFMCVLSLESHALKREFDRLEAGDIFVVVTECGSPAKNLWMQSARQSTGNIHCNQDRPFL